MIKIKYTTLSLFFAMAITLFFACKKTPEGPPIKTALVGGKMTISQVRSLFTGLNYTFTQDVSLYATVTMTDDYKTLYIRDQTGAIAVEQITAHGIYAGDSIRINLNGSILKLTGTASSLEIDSLDVSDSPTCKVVKLAVGRPTPPIPVTIAQLNQSASSITFHTILGSVASPQSIYDGQLVEIINTQFSFTDTSYFIPLSTTSTYVTPTHLLYDCGALNNIQLSLYSGTTDFLTQKVPATKSGSIVGAIGFYNGNLQITPRSFADLKYTQPRCGVDTLTQSFVNCYYDINFGNTFPGWNNLNTYGNFVWAAPSTIGGPPGYIGADNTNTTTARNVMWLITPPIQNSSTKNLQFQTMVTNWLPPFPQQLSVLISTNFEGTAASNNLYGQYNTPSNPAIWYDITYKFTGIQNGSDSLSYFTNAGIGTGLNGAVMLNYPGSPLSGYTGTFYIAFRYTAHQYLDSSQVYAIQNVAIKD
jgi:hypothetical protein